MAIICFLMAAFRHLGFIVRVVRMPTKSIQWSLTSIKFGWNRYSSIDKMQVLIFCGLGLKMPIHASKMKF